MTFIVGYITFLIVFGAIDALWLSVMVAKLYLPVLGDSAAPQMRVLPAIAFYLFYPLGAVFFAALPAIGAGGATAFWRGLFFGAACYATYDLTNFATLRNWSLAVTLADLGYGALVTGFASFAAFAAMRYATS
jgi:uncharacterized membrane protein